MSKKVLILMANPDPETLTGALADAYQTGAEEEGHEVVRVNISDIEFDPVLHKGYKEIQPLEPHLLELQETIRWADHFVLVYPNWWCTMPGVLKGLFDRMWLPGFAFNFNKETKRLEQHLKGKTARVIVVAGTHSPFRTWWKFGDFTNEIQHGILGFAGFKTAVTVFGPSNRVDDRTKLKWLNKIKNLAKKAV